MKKSEAKKIIESNLKIKINKIFDKSRGYDHKVYIAESDKQDVVIRIPVKEKNKLFAQAWAFKEWFKLGIPVPKILVMTDKYLIEERIYGTDMDEIKLNSKQRKNIYYELGKHAKKMHTIKTKKFGYIVKEFEGETDSWKDWIYVDFCSNLSELQKANLIDRELLEKSKKYIDENKNILSNVEPKLLHGDLTPKNLIINNGKLSGIIDASDSISGDPYYDIAIANISANKEAKFFNEGYGDIDTSKVKFYTVYYSMWLLNFFGIIQKMEKEFKLFYDFLKFSL
jgi:aminoglycoside phosphotransferase (APT) family kinase protein